jgi:hypothetical protein
MFAVDEAVPEANCDAGLGFVALGVDIVWNWRNYFYYLTL